VSERDDRETWWFLFAFGAIGITLMYVFDVPYREGWMYWVGVPALAFAITGVLAVGFWFFRRRRLNKKQRELYEELRKVG
jgi:hypothetical protein